MRSAFLILTLSSLLVSCGHRGSSGGGSTATSGAANVVEQEASVEEDEPVVEVPASDGIAKMLGYRSGHDMVRLSDGRILVYGGWSASALVGSRYYSDIIIYDPKQNKWTPAADTEIYREYTRLAVAAGDKVLIGTGATAQVYDAQKDALFNIIGENCASTVERKYAFTATTLSDGRILLAGGNSSATLILEIFDPNHGEAGCFEKIETKAIYRQGHGATQLADGRVLLSGGEGKSANTAAIFDPQNNLVTDLTETMAQARASHGQVVLEDGRVLLVGGWNWGTLGSAEIFDPKSQSFHATKNDLTYKRGSPFLYLIPSGADKGKVMVIGGQPDVDEYLSGVAQMEIFDPETESFLEAPSYLQAAGAHAAVVDMGVGRVMITGGFTGTDSTLVYDFSDLLTL